MKIKLLVDNPRLNELIGVLLALLAIGALLCLVSYEPFDDSANTVTDRAPVRNWLGFPGAFASDLILQGVGLVGFTVPLWIGVLAVGRIRNSVSDHMLRRAGGGLVLTLVFCSVLHLLGERLDFMLPPAWDGFVSLGGAFGKVVAEGSTASLNLGGTILLLAAFAIVGVYLMTSLQLSDLARAPRRAAAPEPQASKPEPAKAAAGDKAPEPDHSVTVVDMTGVPLAGTGPGAPPGRRASDTGEAPPPPIVPYAEDRGSTAFQGTVRHGTGTLSGTSPLSFLGDSAKREYTLPNTSLLKAPLAKPAFDEEQLQETAGQIVDKFEEFKVRGTVSQINPGPVVTTFEYKPDRGVKYSKITNLSEDLCLALECESILVERIPGKATVGIEVPNKTREIISLKEVVDSPAFRRSKPMLTFALGKDINGKIHCADLAGMPHLLVAGQTGSGKSVMINCVIMSLLLRTTPDQVRLILVDPKTVELSLYRDTPHLLTPVITDMKEATNALKNATKEMDRRLHLLAQYGVRNIDQFNAKVEKLDGMSPSGDTLGKKLEKLPYIVVIVDELADLMMLAGRQVEESIQRLAQMARAVGIHLLLATQRPSVDVITGLIKANVPARLSFLLATRVDSRTILDSMGAESLLGKGDMLFLPPGSGRMRRLHGPLVTEDEIEAVVEHWKGLARPQYETDYLALPDGEADDATEEAPPGLDDAKYKEAVLLVVELGKASTSTLQRRLRLGYGRAARILDAMEREGIIGPPDGSRPRQILKVPDWAAGS